MAIYSVLLYYIENFKNGINLLEYVFDKKRISKVNRNNQVIINEDSDVSEERSKIVNTDSDVILFQDI
jgi:hypothetical protein